MVGVEEDYAIVDIGKDTSMICIFRNNTLKFSRILLNGSAEIDSYIASNFNMEYRQAEDIKTSYRTQNTDYLSTGSESNQSTVKIEQNKLTEVIETALGNIASDISRFIEFYNSRETTNQVQKIYLCGGGSNLSGITEIFTSIFNMTVLKYPLKKEIIYKGKKDFKTFEEDYTKLINAIGSLINWYLAIYNSSTQHGFIFITHINIWALYRSNINEY